MARRTLQDLLAMDREEAEAEAQRREDAEVAAWEIENERYVERYFEDRHGAFAHEYADDIALFDATWEWSPGFWGDASVEAASMPVVR